MVRDAAEVDLEQTRRCYDQQREGLREEFLVSIAEAFTRLEEDPERYRVLYEGFRRVLVERFPYKIFYQVKGNTVIVSGCFTTRAIIQGSFNGMERGHGPGQNRMALK